MTGTKIKQIFRAEGVSIGDKILITERLSKGKTGQRYFTLDEIGRYSLRTSDSDLGRRYIIDFNKIENIEAADTL